MQAMFVLLNYDGCIAFRAWVRLPSDLSINKGTPLTGNMGAQEFFGQVS